jgi:hypothetical protein
MRSLTTITDRSTGHCADVCSERRPISITISGLLKQSSICSARTSHAPGGWINPETSGTTRSTTEPHADDPSIAMPAAIPSSTEFGNGSCTGDGCTSTSDDRSNAWRLPGSVHPIQVTLLSSPKDAARASIASLSGPVPAVYYSKAIPVRCDARWKACRARSCPFSQF